MFNHGVFLLCAAAHGGSALAVRACLTNIRFFIHRGLKKYTIFSDIFLFMLFPAFFNSPGVLAPRRGGMGRRKTGAGGRPLRVREIENWFSVRLPHMGAKKKYKAHISKYV